MNKAGKQYRISDSQFGILLALPAIAVFLVVILYPFLNSLGMSLTNRSLMNAETKFIGLGNFLTVFHDPYLYEIVRNTVIFVLGGTLIPFVLGFIWAIILNQGFKGAEILRGITLVDWIIPSTAIGFLWIWIFQGSYGLINKILQDLGFIHENISWLGQTETAMFAVIIAKTWQTLPWFMAFLLGGLNMVPREQIEAARIDGAGNIKIFIHVIYSNMRQIISFLLILGAIGSLQHFDILWVMTKGGPVRATTTLSIAVYSSAFQDWDFGRAAAIGVIWVILIAFFAFYYLKKTMKEEA